MVWQGHGEVETDQHILLCRSHSEQPVAYVFARPFGIGGEQGWWTFQTYRRKRDTAGAFGLCSRPVNAGEVIEAAHGMSLAYAAGDWKEPEEAQ